MNEGLLREVTGKVFPYDELESYLYGFNNRYGLLVRRAYNGPYGTDTINADKGLFEVTPIGIGLKASEIKSISGFFGAQELLEHLSIEEMKAFIHSPIIKELIGNFDAKTGHYNSINRIDIEKFIETAKAQPERPAAHIVEDPIMSPYYSVEEAAKKYKTKTYDLPEEEINQFLNG